MKDEFKDIDFTTARGYIINPNENRLSHAKFFAVQSGRAERSRLATYAKKNGLSVTLYQDYGWPAKKLKE